MAVTEALCLMQTWWAVPISAASHRVRVTDWFQASAAVPVSSSRAISGRSPEQADDGGRQQDDPGAEQENHVVGLRPATQ